MIFGLKGFDENFVCTVIIRIMGVLVHETTLKMSKNNELIDRECQRQAEQSLLYALI